MRTNTIRAVLFDFGGVLAEEGFQAGLKAIAKEKGVDPDSFFFVASEIIHETGYVTGLSDERRYWDTVRQRTGITGSDTEFRENILKRLVLRPKMLEHAGALRNRGLNVSILSDQTDWLEKLDRRIPFYHHFDYVFNSFRLKKSKRDPSVFRDVCVVIGCIPGEVLFVDDNGDNVKRASREGLKTIHFKSIKDFEKQISAYV